MRLRVEAQGEPRPDHREGSLTMGASILTGGATERSRRPRAAVWAATAFACLLVTACGGDGDAAPEVAVAVSFDPLPFVGPTTCTVALRGADGAPVTGASLQVEGNMNHAGMVPVFVDLTAAGDGIYAGPFEFTMGGDWFVVIRGELADGRALERVIDVPAVPVTRKDAAGDPER